MKHTPYMMIKIENLCVYGFHGVLEEEKRLGQRFYISAEVKTRLHEGILRDSYEDALCYARLCQHIKESVTGEKYDLIEYLAAKIGEEILEREKLVEEVMICVRKPSAPMDFALDGVSVEVSLKRTYPFALSLGSNLGARKNMIENALQRLMRYEGVEIEKISSFYETQPWGGVAQEKFLNICALGKTSLTPHNLLRVCKESEEQLGRVIGEKWGARALDIDILYYGEKGEIMCDDFTLSLPHRYLYERVFVLVPLLEIAPALEIAGRSLQKELEKLPRSEGDIQLYCGG